MGRTTAIDAFGGAEKIRSMRGTTFFAVGKIRAASGGKVAKTPTFFTTKWVREGQVDFVHGRGHVDFGWLD